MRLALINHYAHVVGGTEAYLRSILPDLQRIGFEIRLWHEAPPASGSELLFPSGVACSVAEMGQDLAYRELAGWRPDVIFSQGTADPDWEARLPEAGPVVHFAHTYHGTCISGNKCWSFPVPRPCHRTFGWQCLAHYFPHRCGGLSPVTMWQNFQIQGRRLETLRSFHSILTASSYMRDEYLQHGFDPERVVVAGLYLPDGPVRKGLVRERTPELNRILFCGRMVATKGGKYLVDAAPLAARQLGRILEVTFAGAGPEEQAWKAAAELTTARHSNVRFRFLGWRSQQECAALYRESDLLVAPSLWPEPFGLNGPEAGQLGLPSVAFSVGGITDWLKDGVNGHLASGEPPEVEGLADAIVRSLRDPEHYRELSRAAVETGKSLNLRDHLAKLLPVLEAATGVNLAG